MGCTSSAPNMPESPTSTTDDVVNLQPSDESRERIKVTDNNIYSNGHSELEQVLPKCEIRNNQTQLVRNNNTPPVTHRIDSDVDNTDTQHVSPTAEVDHTVNTMETTKSEESFVSLKDVVDKVISDNTGEDDHTTNHIEETQNVDLDRQNDDFVKESSDNDGVNEIEPNDEIENVKESASPSQSEDSRATRWEALADIAAELPPSLAVDPLTGQIYSLAK